MKDHVKGSRNNEVKKSINRLRESMKNKKSKISSMKRKRSPMEVNRVISKMKSDSKAMGGGFHTMGELKALKGESKKSFKQRPSTKFRKDGKA